jgi:hypothetical protein
MKKALLLTSLIGLTLVSCSKKEDPQEQAAQQMAQSMEQMGQAMQPADGAANKAPGVAIPAKTLVTFLPTIDGYQVNGEAEYMEMEMQGTKYSHASQSFTNGDKRIKVSIFDYNYIAGLTAGFAMLMNMNMETNTEITRSEKIGGFPGWFNWHKQSNDGTIGVVVSDRVFVTIDGDGGVTEDELHAVANAVNLSGIAGAVQ